MNLKNRRGMTLIELILAIFFISLIAVLISQTVFSGLQGRQMGQERLDSLALATSYLEDLKSMDAAERSGYLSINGFAGSGPLYQGNREIGTISYPVEIRIGTHTGTGLTEITLTVRPPDSTDLTLSVLTRE